MCLCFDFFLLQLYWCHFLLNHSSFFTSVEASAELSCDYKPATQMFCQQTNTHDLLCCESSLWIHFINFAHSLLSHIIWCCSTLLKNATGSKLTFAPRSAGLRHRFPPASAASVWDRFCGERPWLAHMLIPSLNKVTQLTKWPSNEGIALHIDALFSKEDLHSNGIMNSRLTTDWW